MWYLDSGPRGFLGVSRVGTVRHHLRSYAWFPCGARPHLRVSCAARISIQVRPGLQLSFDCQTRRRLSVSPSLRLRIPHPVASRAERRGVPCPAPRTADTQPPPPPPRSTTDSLSGYSHCYSPACDLRPPAAQTLDRRSSPVGLTVRTRIRVRVYSVSTTICLLLSWCSRFSATEWWSLVSV